MVKDLGQVQKGNSYIYGDIKISHRFLINALLAFMCVSTAQAQDDIVDDLFKYLRQARDIPEEAHRVYGTKFDELVKEFYDNMVADKLAERRSVTFAGDPVSTTGAKTGIYRIGNTEVWIAKGAPGTGGSVDIIVWDLQHDAEGKLVSARGTGMDHHTFHPESPRARPSNIAHWESKVATAELWENALERRGIDAKINMHPDNSFYWKDAALDHADEIDDFTRQRLNRARANLSRHMGKAVFVKTAVRTLGTTAGLLGVTAAGIEIMDALERFYRSPVLSRTRNLLANGEYARARRYWIDQCVNFQTGHEDCNNLQFVLAKNSSLLSAATFQGFGPFMQTIFDRWESRESDENAALLEPEPRPRPPDPIGYESLPNSTYLTLQIDDYPPRTVLKGQIIPINARLHAYVDGYRVRVDGAPVKRTLNDAEPEIYKTNNEGVVSFDVTLPDRVASNVLTLEVERHNLDRKYFISSYEYAVEQNGEFPIGWANGEDSILLSFKLTKRFIDLNGKLFSREPLGYRDDLESVAFQPKWTGQPTVLKLGLNSQTMDIVVKLEPNQESGVLAFLMTAPSPGDFVVVADLRGGKFRNTISEAGEFVVTFNSAPAGLRLKWADSMLPFVVGNRVAFPELRENATERFELGIVAVRELNGQVVPVAGIPIRLEIAPKGHARLGNALPITNNDGIAMMGDESPFVWGANVGTGIITISAEGAMNRLEAEVSGRAKEIGIGLEEFEGWVGVWSTNRGDLTITRSGGTLKVTPSGNGLLERWGGKVYVEYADETVIKGRWTLEDLGFDGKFFLERQGNRFNGKFSEKPDEEPTRRWSGGRIR